MNNDMFDLLPEEGFPHALGKFRRVLRPGGRMAIARVAAGTAGG